MSLLRASRDRNRSRPPVERSAPSQYLRDVIYGAMDGAVTTFAVVSGVTGAGLSPKIILVLGVAGVVGDGFSMAAGNYLGTKADNQRTETGNNTEEKSAVMDRSNPLIAAVMTLIAFLVAGSIPLLPYAAAAMGWSYEPLVGFSTTLTLCTFFAVGAGKSLVLPVRWWTAGLESLGVGALAAALAYACGHLLGGLA